MSFLARLLKLWLVVTFFALSGYFAIYNKDSVAVSLPPWIEHISLPGYMLFMGYFALGVLLASLFFAIDSVRKSLEIRRLHKEIAALGGGRNAPLARSKPMVSSDVTHSSEPTVGATL